MRSPTHALFMQDLEEKHEGAAAFIAMNYAKDGRFAFELELKMDDAGEGGE